MTSYDPVDPAEPLDVTSVAADDELVERLRRSLSPTDAVVWDEDDDGGTGEDRSYALLRALQLDVTSSAIPSAPPRGAAPVLVLAGRRRGLGRSATVAAVTAGVLAVGGAAAAATSAPGDAMYGVRSAVASAVQEVVDAITPTELVGPALPPATAGATPTATITPPGQSVSAAARSAAATRQISERISTAKRLLAAGRVKPALEVLDQATRRLPLVTDVTLRAALDKQIAELRAVAAARTQRQSPSAQPREERPAPVDKGGKRPAAKPSRTPAAVSRSSDADSSKSTSRTQGARKAPQLPAAAQPDGRRDVVDR